jgi:hypothetical protein
MTRYIQKNVLQNICYRSRHTSDLSQIICFYGIAWSVQARRLNPDGKIIFVLQFVGENLFKIAKDL